MLILFPNEKTKEVFFEGKSNFRYAITNFGRLIKFSRGIKTDGKPLKGGLTCGYPSLHYKIETKHYCIYFHKLVAEKFVKKENLEQNMVLHLDFNKQNNHFSNLKWCTKQESLQHQFTNPDFKRGNPNPKTGSKLNAKQVVKIKRKLIEIDLLVDKKEKQLKLNKLTSYYNISKVQLNRIKKGESWNHIKVF